MLEVRDNTKERGFTLVELIVVALLLGLLGSIIYGTISTMVRTKNALESRRVTERSAQAILTKLTKELENHYAEALSKPDKEGLPKKVTTDENEEEEAESSSLLLGRSRKVRGMDADLIRFITVGNSASSQLGNPGVVEVEYRLEPASNAPNMNAPRLLLVREEIPAALQDQKAVEARRFRTVLSDRVQGLQFRYRFNKRWVNQWSEKRESYPDAVEITLVLTADSGDTDTYRTAVTLFRSGED